MSLAIGIGANTAIFTLIDAVLLRSLPIVEPDRLHFVARHHSGGTLSFGYRDFRQLQAANPDFRVEQFAPDSVKFLIL